MALVALSLLFNSTWWLKALPSWFGVVPRDFSTILVSLTIFIHIINSSCPNRQNLKPQGLTTKRFISYFQEVPSCGVEVKRFSKVPWLGFFVSLSGRTGPQPRWHGKGIPFSWKGFLSVTICYHEYFWPWDLGSIFL